MAVQLSLNQGPQDKLLFDNTKSYFTNVGYQRTSNFQMQLRDVDPQNAANFGQTVSFIIPKAADLLGPVDLMIEFNKVDVPQIPGRGEGDNLLEPGQAQAWGWVDNVGYAMIEKITFSVGSHDVETLTGESLNIINELMRNGNNRYGFHQTLKTGRPLFKQTLDGGKNGTSTGPNRSYPELNPDPAYDSYDRIISYKQMHYHKLMYNTHDAVTEPHSTWWDSLERPGMVFPHISSTNHNSNTNVDVVAKEGKHLCVPLGLFFTQHPSKYFPIAAIAGCNDIRVTIKFKQVKEVLMQKGTLKQAGDLEDDDFSYIRGPTPRDQNGVIQMGIKLDQTKLTQCLMSIVRTTSRNNDVDSSGANWVGGLWNTASYTAAHGHREVKLLVISHESWYPSTADHVGKRPHPNDAVFEVATTRCQEPGQTTGASTTPDDDTIGGSNGHSWMCQYFITGLRQIRPGNIDPSLFTGVQFYWFGWNFTEDSAMPADENKAPTYDSYGNFTSYGSCYSKVADYIEIPDRWVASTGGWNLAGAIHSNPGTGYVVDQIPAYSSQEPSPSNGQWFNKCQLRCHYVHVTGPEATALMGKEHVRLMKLMDDTNHLTKQFAIKCSPSGSSQVLAMDLNFLHPIQEIIITIRKLAELGSSTDNSVSPGTGDGVMTMGTGGIKNYFAYHGGGKDPNFENWTSYVNCSDPIPQVRQPTYLKTTTFQLKLNGQSRHLDGQGIDRDYLMNRLMPMIHSAARDDFTLVAEHSQLEEFEQLSEMMDRKEIYVYPFALNPEGANPSGSVNFSKVSHARLEIGVDGYAPGLSTPTANVDDQYIVDVYGMYYNWLAIKDGRALTSFA
jgi:hypothetical protein